MTEFLDISEFRRLGYLQEVNRQFLHPLGLALEVVVEEDGTERLGGIWDYRDDPEGIFFGEDIIDRARTRYVADEFHRIGVERQTRLGFAIQPVPGPHYTLPEDRLDP